MLNILWSFLKLPLMGIGHCLKLIRRQILGGHVLVKRGDVYYIPAWLPIMLIVGFGILAIWDDVLDIAVDVRNRATVFIADLTYQPPQSDKIAPLFAPAIHHWGDYIKTWSDTYEVDIHLMSTIMQIESCGHPTVVSSAGAQGLFQVMPFHFETGENMTDPNTNAKRGGLFMNYCFNAAGQNVGLTLACYNGGPSVINRPSNTWAAETQRYYRWGMGIYTDAIANQSESETLNQWMNAGGSRLCTSALNELKTYSPSIAMQTQ